jgi:hypothetical protein
MGKLDTPFGFTGRIKLLTFYKMKGVDGWIIRSKGGPRKKDIKSNPRLADMRSNMTEFRGRARAAKYIRKALKPVVDIVGGRIQGRLTSETTHIQQMDKHSRVGERPILFSRYGKLLEGFEFNPHKPLSIILKKKIVASIDRSKGTANINIPAVLIPLSKPYTCYRFVASLGIVDDLKLKTRIDPKSGYQKINSEDLTVSIKNESSWLKGKPSKTVVLDLQLKEKQRSESNALILAVAIQFGRKERGGKITEFKGGSGMILAVT